MMCRCLFKQTLVLLFLLFLIVILTKTLHNYLGLNLTWMWTGSRQPKLLCHFETSKDILPSIYDLDPGENSIFFHETSCRGSLTSRQACAVESAALQHPYKQIYVLFSAPLTKDQNLKKIYNFDNVHFARIYINYSDGTLIDTWLHEMYNKSSFANHVADVLRFVTLSKWGGIYLDLDAVVVKPLDRFGRNWATKEDENVINIGAMAFARDEVGWGIVMKVFEEMQRNYDPLGYTFGRNALTKAIKRYCNVTHIQKVNGKICKGFNIYGPKLFYPVHWSEHLYYFKPGFLRYQNRAAIMYHTWERLTYNVTIEKRSPYNILAKNYCPKTYEMFIDDFGGRDLE